MADTLTPIYNFVKPEVGASGDTWGTKWNANIDAIETRIKAAMDQALASLDAANKAQQVGTYVLSAAATVTGALLCDGTAVSRVTYAALFTAIGTTYGTGDGTNTFNIPDFRGVFPRGLDKSRGLDPNRALGVLQADDVKGHTHAITVNTAGGHSHGGQTAGNNVNHQHYASGQTDTQGDHNHGGPGGLNFVVSGGPNAGGTGLGYKQATTTGNAGSHLHNIGFWTGIENQNHVHTIATDGAHTHVTTAAQTGGTETRPQNLAVNFFIRY